MPEVVVVGAGMAGSAAAWSLARRGRSVLLLERFGQGHDRGSSHGAERIFRFGYADAVYVQLAQESLPGWHDLQEAAGAPLLHHTGVVDHGDDTELAQLTAACSEAGISVEELTPAEAASRWPGLRFAGPVIHQPDGGRLDADRTLAAFWDQAAAAGADVRFGVPVAAVHRRGDAVEIAIGDAVVAAGAVVVAAAGWTAELLEAEVVRALVPPITVTAESVAWFRPRTGPWPSFIQRGVPLAYGLASPDGLVKAGLHGTGPVVHPDDRPARDADAVAAIAAYAREWLPGVEPAPVRTDVCLYASTDSDDFVLDRHGSVVVGLGFGGHGFKFAPAIGERLADLAEEALGLRVAGPQLFGADRLPGRAARAQPWR